MLWSASRGQTEAYWSFFPIRLSSQNLSSLSPGFRKIGQGDYSLLSQLLTQCLDWLDLQMEELRDQPLLLLLLLLLLQQKLDIVPHLGELDASFLPMIELY